MCFTHLINLVVQKFIRAVIVIPNDDNEGNIDIGNGDNFTLDIDDGNLASVGIISKLRAVMSAGRVGSQFGDLSNLTSRSYRCAITRPRSGYTASIIQPISHRPGYNVSSIQLV